MKLIRLLTDSYHSWIGLQVKIADLYRRGDNKFGKNYIKDFEKIKRIEIEIMESFQTLWN